MTFGPLPPCPFVAGPMIKDPRQFVGRRRSLLRLKTLMQQPTSANVIGERRIGKSSLLYHFYQTWREWVDAHEQYCVVYLNLQGAQCDRERTFYRAIITQLTHEFSIQASSTQVSSTQVSSTQVIDCATGDLNRASFSEIIKGYRRMNVLPVLCLDEFEALFKHTQEFNDGFFDNLRSLMNEGEVMLILASHKSLDFYKREYRLTSDFFNLGQVILLEDLEPAEVDELVRLPASTVSGLPAALGVSDQQKAKDWGGRHPCKLQHAASFLYQAAQGGHGEKWAKQQFDREVERLPKRKQKPDPVRALINLGKLARGIGGNLDDFGNLVAGVVIVIFVILAVLGILRWEQIKAFLEGLGG